MAGSCEHCSEPSGFIKGGEFLDQLSVLLASVGEVSYFLLDSIQAGTYNTGQGYYRRANSLGDSWLAPLLSWKITKR
jgi:hypothetical protein